MQIIIKLTTICNLNCVYCSEGDKPAATLAEEDVYKLINELPELLDTYHDKSITLLWHGGEPMTVGTPYLDRIMAYAEKILDGYDLRFLMQTNLTLLNDDWIQLLLKYNVGIGVSLDGYKELHDENRKGKGGKPTFDLIVDNLKKLQRNEIKCGILMVLNTEVPIDIDKLYDLIKMLGCDIKIHPVIPCGRAANNLHAKEIYDNYIEVLKLIFVKCMEDMEDDVNIEPINSLLRAILTDGTVRECSFNGSCGKGFMCMYATGEIGFCGRAETEALLLGYGNIKTGRLKDIYESVNAQKIRDRQKFLKENSCKACLDWKLCHGGCAFEAINAFGTLEATYPHCESRHKFIDFLKTTGLQMLKRRLIKEKEAYKEIIQIRKDILSEIGNQKQ